MPRAAAGTGGMDHREGVRLLLWEGNVSFYADIVDETL